MARNEVVNEQAVHDERSEVHLVPGLLREEEMGHGHREQERRPIGRKNSPGATLKETRRTAFQTIAILRRPEPERETRHHDENDDGNLAVHQPAEIPGAGIAGKPRENSKIDMMQHNVEGRTSPHAVQPVDTSEARS
jgi:hypothetical protein